MKPISQHSSVLQRSSIFQQTHIFKYTVIALSLTALFGCNDSEATIAQKQTRPIQVIKLEPLYHQFEKSFTGKLQSSETAGVAFRVPGTIQNMMVSVGDSVKKGDVVCTLESMKMQVSVKAHKDGVVKSIKIKETASVAKGDAIADIE